MGFWGNAIKKSTGILYWYIPWIKTGELNNDIIYDSEEKITIEAIKKSSAKLFPINTVAIAMYGATIGKVAVLGVDATTNQACACAVCLKCLYHKYLFYYALSQKEQFIEKGKGGAQPNISQEIIKQHVIPLPPLMEQQRIVNIIESLFEKLDRAKELVQNALDSFESRKSAILHKVFTGELTAKWREENGVEFNWEKKILKDVSDFRAGYAFDSSKFSDAGYQVIRMGNLYNGVLDLSRNPVFIKIEDVDENVIKRSKIHIGDILLTLTGTKYKRDYGFAVLITEEADILLNQRILSLTAKNVETIYLLNYLKTDLFRDVFFSNETGGVNQGNVSSKFVETIEIPIPPPSEQKEIVRILNSLLEKEQEANELCDIIDKIDIMKKSILSRALRGELGTNNPEEKSALELLKQVLQEKISKD